MESSCEQLGSLDSQPYHIGKLIIRDMIDCGGYGYQ